ncbi:MGMT family protein [Microbacterium insulae]|uniref:MGMT family protein n=1 Tax=Microbacterium insulae TaxID=483014 RepID=A0ABW3AGL4_9MICO
MSELTDRVVQIVQSIPAGRVMTYGAVAREARTGARAVARVLYHGGHEIPWWRVVSAEGRPYPGAVHDARARLREEATPLHEDTDDPRVDLERAAWNPSA